MKLNTPKDQRLVGYFSMEIGLDEKLPTYSGGLGVLAGDTIKSAADLRVPLVGVSLVHDKGYFYQTINNGEQGELPVDWKKEELLKPLEEEVTVEVEGRTVKVKAWEYIVKGFKEYEVPVIFLDTDVEGNSDYDRSLTRFLYGGDQKYRLCQEIVLGIGGLKMLNQLGYTGILKYHLNEGHAALLGLELLEELNGDLDKARKKCVFTTHTPVPAGHDKFPVELVRGVLPRFPFDMEGILDDEGRVNMTLLGLVFSRYVNGVAKSHKEVSRKMFPDYPIDSVTNGVHASTWASDSFIELFDKHIAGWRKDNFCLRYAEGIPSSEVWRAHAKSKDALVELVNQKAKAGFHPERFTIGFARRFTSYKRPLLLFRDIDRLNRIAEKYGDIQVVFAGKAHPKDFRGKELIKKVFEIKKKLSPKINLVFLDNYDMYMAKILVSGVDLWLNTPLRPKEASGTSGMKAAVNGVPSLSVLDGWWIEGCIENVTGWSIGPQPDQQLDGNTDEIDARDLYNKLESSVLPMFYGDRQKWVKIMKHSIAINASFFNTHRMIQQYVLNAYFH